MRLRVRMEEGNGLRIFGRNGRKHSEGTGSPFPPRSELDLIEKLPALFAKRARLNTHRLRESRHQVAHAGRVVQERYRDLERDRRRHSWIREGLHEHHITQSCLR